MPKQKTTKPKVPPPISPAKWQALTPRQRLLAIAKDVLAQLATRRRASLIPYTGIYVGEEADVLDGLSARETRARLVEGIRCRACAIGSMWISRVRLADGVAGEDLAGTYDRVRQEVGEAQAAEIETAFESAVFGGGSNEAVRFGQRYSDDRTRLRKIMQNIVAGRGVFDPARKARAAK